MSAEVIERHRLNITGVVQGVGFRPFVYRLAQACELDGWVSNDPGGVCVEVQGDLQLVQAFIRQLPLDLPERADIHSLTSSQIPICSESGFSIRESATGAVPTALILPDIAPCEACLQELSDPAARRYRYPFINCTQCGPRFSIVERLPYDRAHTAMKHFALCDPCQREYGNPVDRRFHAEPTACQECGPQLALCRSDGTIVARGEDALQKAAEAIRRGSILALKSIGGFQLMVDASNAESVSLLRARKQRPHKPFALIYPDITSVVQDCFLSEPEQQLLSAPERPIVILKGRPQASMHVAREVAPGNPNIGVMLPCSPLHHLLSQALESPLVATSGNRGGEPICTRDEDAIQRLGDIADLFLVHDRPILRPLDDSVVRVMDGKPAILRRARGYAPRPLQLPEGIVNNGDLLALGADLKNTVAVCRGRTVHLSQYLGDLQNPRVMANFQSTIEDLTKFHGLSSLSVVYDPHPGYSSRRWAEASGQMSLAVQHHVAHFFACMAEHGHGFSALGVCWDGSGYGEDGTLRGSEFLQWDGRVEVNRRASIRSFPLPGGELAIREPRRALAGILYEALGEAAFSKAPLLQLFKRSELPNLKKMLTQDINSPRCSSVGRLFDGFAALCGLAGATSFEGQAAMAVEFAAEKATTDHCYPFKIEQDDGHRILDWAPMLSAVLEDIQRGVKAEVRAAIFHNTLANMVLSIAETIGERDVFLSGGVFQNKNLLEKTAGLLRTQGFRPHSHSQVPANDGGLALGQMYYARAMAACGLINGKGGALCV
ncbi:carbamoyltransferase HypF [Microbulbifer aggregans]|uniref:carbamoyltransferase HypF n=1 Tax=Microbulbifer aggregans TaxID=1769779 RepID=UPI001CFCD038|nr:carbamoyltransferase HypF [Microbulbifer aggregans]